MNREDFNDHPNRDHFLASGLPECQCKEAGYCSVFRKFVGSNLHSHCQNSAAYRGASIDLARRQKEEETPEGLAERERRKKIQAEKAESVEKFNKVVKELKDDGLSLEGTPPEGLGDTVEKVLSKFGITKSLMEKVAGEKGCKCSERKAWLNKIFPYKKKD